MVVHRIYMQRGCRGPFEEREGGSDCQTFLFLFFYQQSELIWRAVEVKKIKVNVALELQTDSSMRQ